MSSIMRTAKASLWVDVNWDPITGCNPVSTGCQNCMGAQAVQRWNGEKYPPGFRVKLYPDRLDQPLQEKKPRRVLVGGLGDLFHDEVPTPYIFKVLSRMAQAPKHTYFLLTKRAKRMWQLLHEGQLWPLPNVNVGVSAENQDCYNLRVPYLVNIPVHSTAYRYVACEPLLGHIFLGDYAQHIGWITCSGERGPHARPASDAWFATLGRQCQAHNIPIFHHRPTPNSNDRLHTVCPTMRTHVIRSDCRTEDWPFIKGDKPCQ